MIKLNKKGQISVDMLIYIGIGLLVVAIAVLAYTGVIPLYKVFGGGQGLSTAEKTCVAPCAAVEYAGFCVSGLDVKGLTDTQINDLKSKSGFNNFEGSKAKGVTCFQLAKAGLIADCANKDICSQLPKSCRRTVDCASFDVSNLAEGAQLTECAKHNGCEYDAQKNANKCSVKTECAIATTQGSCTEANGCSWS
jgi:hypothetical protein